MYTVPALLNFSIQDPIKNNKTKQPKETYSSCTKKHSVMELKILQRINNKINDLRHLFSELSKVTHPSKVTPVDNSMELL